MNTHVSPFRNFVRHILPPIAAALVLLLIIVLVTSTSSAQGCGIHSFTMTPEHPLIVGQQVRLEGTSNCGTVKFTVRNTATGQVWDKAETGQPNQQDWWYTNETGPGNFDVCFLGRGPDGGWEVAASSCKKGVFVQGSAVSATPVPQPNQPNPPQVQGRAEFQGGCNWNVILDITGFAANAEVWLSMTSSARDCSGRQTNPSWSDWSHGNTDGNGRKTIVITHGDYGSYDFVVRDSHNNRVNVTVRYDSAGGNNSGSGNNNGGGSTSPQPQPTNVPQQPAQPTNRPQQPSQPTQPSQPNNNGCNPLSGLMIGDIAYVSDQTPDPVPMRSGAGTSHSIIMQVPILQYVAITGGPICSGNLVWWEVRKDGRTGWMAEINGLNNRNLIFVRGSEEEIEEDAFVELHLDYEPFESTYVFQVDRSNQSLCVIMNGSEIVAQETIRFSNWASDQFSTHSLADASRNVVDYLRSDGDIDTFRVSIIHFLQREVGCSHSYYYLTTDREMDLSGLGNVMYGYFAVFLPRWSAHRIADVDQLVKDNRLDFPDDSTQIDWGRNIARSDLSITARNILPLIPEHWVNGR